MVRFIFLISLIGFCLARGVVAHAQGGSTSPPLTYEVLINGESFLVEGNRVTKAQSKEKPGTTYEIAVRMSPIQVLRLNSVKLEYEMPAKVSDDRGKDQRSVQIRHELGFSIMITDLGEPLDAEGQEKALKAVTEFAAKSAQNLKATDLTIGEPGERKFQGAVGRGTTIQFRDARGMNRTSQVCVLGGPKFAVTCVVEYVDVDREDSLPLIKKTLDSIQALR